MLFCNGVDAGCRFVGRIAALGRDDLILAAVDPAIPVPHGEDLREVLLVPREAGVALLSLPQSSVPVYVCRPPSESDTRQIEVVAWGSIAPASARAMPNP